MNIILIGSGGRENAIAHTLAKSPLMSQLYIIPGNPGTAALGQNVPLNPMDFSGIEKFALDNQVEFILVGPEAPLVAGISDHFTKHKNIFVIGPSKAGAQLEGSKAFSKKFMQRHNIPTASYVECNNETIEEGVEFLKTMNSPYVLKADGLAGGKGVLIIDNIEETIEQLKEMLSGKFGQASSVVVIEEFLSGIEFSMFVLTDGKDYVILPEAKDYKRIGEGDTGLNTGGMGAISPVPFVDEVLLHKVEERIIKPTVEGLKKEDIDYCGFIFIGLINVNDEPYVIEYNCRMGDPETEVVFPRINSDFCALMKEMKNNNLNSQKLEISSSTAATVMLVSDGYPSDYKVGHQIIIGNDIHKDSIVFHAGTKQEGKHLLTNGGRVLSITAFGTDIEEALAKSYTTIEQISFEGMYYRGDIGQDLM
ncbi:MAG: hypothetical protein RLZZ546_2455 [Bacteroidota bacterium]|jgi:phosphoribosylamine--glycine ligase